jgi:hypothetical protein
MSGETTMNANKNEQRSELFEFDMFVRLFCNDEEPHSPRVFKPTFSAPLQVKVERSKSVVSQGQPIAPTLPYPQYLDWGHC